jgi:hypothetical protein
VTEWSGTPDRSLAAAPRPSCCRPPRIAPALARWLPVLRPGSVRSAPAAGVEEPVMASAQPAVPAPVPQSAAGAASGEWRLAPAMGCPRTVGSAPALATPPVSMARQAAPQAGCHRAQLQVLLPLARQQGRLALEPVQEPGRSVLPVPGRSAPPDLDSPVPPLAPGLVERVWRRLREEAQAQYFPAPPRPAWAQPAAPLTAPAGIATRFRQSPPGAEPRVPCGPAGRRPFCAAPRRPPPAVPAAAGRAPRGRVLPRCGPAWPAACRVGS